MIQGQGHSDLTKHIFCLDIWYKYSLGLKINLLDFGTQRSKVKVDSQSMFMFSWTWYLKGIVQRKIEICSLSTHHYANGEVGEMFESTKHFRSLW